MDGYFQEFKKKMKNGTMIPKSLVDKYYDYICFLVDTDITYIQVVIPRTIWLRPLAYEINLDEAIIAIRVVLYEPIDKDVKPFGRYEIAKVKITMEINVPKINKKRKGMIENLERTYGEGRKHE